MTAALTPDIWNVLHDGTIIEAAGVVPGDVRLTIAIDYLRSRFPDVGKHVLLTLRGCTALMYELDATGRTITKLDEIGEAEPEILRADEWKNANKVYCASGILHVFARAFSLALDSGRPVALKELIDVAEAYWTEWEEGCAQPDQNSE